MEDNLLFLDNSKIPKAYGIAQKLFIKFIEKDKSVSLRHLRASMLCFIGEYGNFDFPVSTDAYVHICKGNYHSTLKESLTAHPVRLHPNPHFLDPSKVRVL